jgi:hypothetical protein
MQDLNRFDPFKSRLARDIRNTLSKSFIESLREVNRDFFQRKAAQLLEPEQDQPYQDYITSRLSKYEAVFAVITRDHLTDELLQAEVLWDNGLFYEIHELLETVWIKAEGKERKALQGLIRAAGMKVHAEVGNKKAAVSMGQKALTDLRHYGDQLKDFNRLNSILGEIKDVLESMDSPA